MPQPILWLCHGVDNLRQARAVVLRSQIECLVLMPTWFDMSLYGLMGTISTFSFNDVKRGKIPRMYPEFLAPWQVLHTVWIGICWDSFDSLLGFYIDHVHSTPRSVCDENGAISHASLTERTLVSICKR